MAEIIGRSVCETCGGWVTVTREVVSGKEWLAVQPCKTCVRAAYRRGREDAQERAIQILDERIAVNRPVVAAV